MFLCLPQKWVNNKTDTGIMLNKIKTHPNINLHMLRSPELWPSCWPALLRPMILIDWLAESESHFLGHIIVIIWPINNVYTTATWLPFNHCYKINRTSWPRKWKIPMSQKTSHQSKSIIGLSCTLQLRIVRTRALCYRLAADNLAPQLCRLTR